MIKFIPLLDYLWIRVSLTISFALSCNNKSHNSMFGETNRCCNRIVIAFFSVF